MGVKIKKLTLWRTEVDNDPGALAGVLEPLAASKADLKVVMGYRFPGNNRRAAIELAPVSGKKKKEAAGQAGLADSGIPTLSIKGTDKPGLGYKITKALAESGINIDFFVAQVIGKDYSAIIGFDSETDARSAALIIKKVSTKKK